MTAQSTLSPEAVRPAIGAVGSVNLASGFVGRSRKFGRRTLVNLALISWDILLALTVWQAAVVVQGIWGRGSLSALALASMVPYVVVWIGSRASLGLYPGYGLGQVEELRRQTIALLFTVTTVSVFAFASQTGDSLSRILLFGWGLGLLLLAPVARCSLKCAIMKAGLWGKPVVVLGAREAGVRLLKSLQQDWQLGYNPVAVFDARVPVAKGLIEGVPYEGNLTDAVAYARKRGIETAIFAMPHTRREHLSKFVDLYRSHFCHVVVVPNLDGITNSAVVARDFGGMFGVEIRHNLLDPWAQRSKRVLDLLATVVGGAFVLPVILALFLLVWLESGGSVFYADKRMGKDGRLFPCLKFRTMVPDAEALLQRMLDTDEALREEYLTYHKLREDPRVTRVGRFLRKTSLDELPQLWNVLRGEMSLVGPRPYLPRESADIGDTQDEILRVTPGITGPWQVSGRNDTSFGERVRMDAVYVRDWSVWLDLVLLARTVGCLVFSRGAR